MNGEFCFFGVKWAELHGVGETKYARKHGPGVEMNMGVSWGDLFKGSGFG